MMPKAKFKLFFAMLIIVSIHISALIQPTKTKHNEADKGCLILHRQHDMARLCIGLVLYNNLLIVALIVGKIL